MKNYLTWPALDTPCIGYCSTSLGDEVCKGCGRSLAEVDRWIAMSDAEKAAVWKRIEAAGVGIRWQTGSTE
ncbi:MAG: DUF1289 domain-containing protein [Burkholderiaceae bacterium]|jgi:predicted Fe-S protein YdhL (DUF1289 family)